MMFEWLRDEIDRVKTQKSCLIDGPLPPDGRKLVEQSDLPVPPSYKNFVIRFGNAKLYRRGSRYLVQVFVYPGQVEMEDGQLLRHFGRTDDSLAYFKESLLVPGGESPVFEWRHEQGIQQTASGFEEWLRKVCKSAKRRYTKKEWREIEKGPPPFSEEERRIVDARRKFRWRIVGIAPSGDIQFEVHNESDIVLPFLTIGIRGKRRGTDAVLDGGAWLPVGTVYPGQTGVIEKSCYKEWVDPHDVVAFDEPDPEPEDRDRYWEFRALESHENLWH